MRELIDKLLDAIKVGTTVEVISITVVRVGVDVQTDEPKDQPKPGEQS